MQQSKLQVIILSFFLIGMLTTTTYGQANSQQETVIEKIISSLDSGQEIYLEGNPNHKTHVFIWSIKGKLLSKQEVPPFKSQYKVDLTLLPKGKAILEWWNDEKRTAKSIIIK